MWRRNSSARLHDEREPATRPSCRASSRPLPVRIRLCLAGWYRTSVVSANPATTLVPACQQFPEAWRSAYAHRDPVKSNRQASACGQNIMNDSRQNQYFVTIELIGFGYGQVARRSNFDPEVPVGKDCDESDATDGTGHGGRLTRIPHFRWRSACGHCRRRQPCGRQRLSRDLWFLERHRRHVLRGRSGS